MKNLESLVKTVNAFGFVVSLSQLDPVYPFRWHCAIQRKNPGWKVISTSGFVTSAYQAVKDAIANIPAKEINNELDTKAKGD